MHLRISKSVFTYHSVRVAANIFHNKDRISSQIENCKDKKIKNFLSGELYCIENDW
jgi:hypothetical protein